MRRLIIADTSCLITLSNSGHLELLRVLYGNVQATPEIAEEYGKPLPDWVTIESARDRSRSQVLQLQIDRGESSAISLAMEHPGATVILDDLKARKIATALGIKHTGTIGVIVKAKIQGHISSIQPLLDALKKAGFRMSPALEKEALLLAGE